MHYLQYVHFFITPPPITPGFLGSSVLVKEELGKMGAIKLKYNEAMFYWKKDAALQAIRACHVDDFIFSGTALFMDNVVKLLKKKFKVSAEGEDRSTYTGVQIDQNAKYITVRKKTTISSQFQCLMM